MMMIWNKQRKQSLIRYSYILFLFNNNILFARHTHWSNLRPIIESNPQTIFILIHFSRRYKRKHIRETINKENLSNVVIFLADECENCFDDYSK